MKTGRKPKSNAARQLDGTSSSRRTKFKPLSCEAAAVKPRCIEDDPTASVEWDRLMAAVPEGHFTALDVGNLTIYCQAWSLRQQALDAIHATGLGGARGSKNPALVVLRQADTSLMHSGDRLGLALADRDRVAGLEAGLTKPERGAAAHKAWLEDHYANAEANRDPEAERRCVEAGAAADKRRAEAQAAVDKRRAAEPPAVREAREAEAARRRAEFQAAANERKKLYREDDAAV